MSYVITDELTREEDDLASLYKAYRNHKRGRKAGRLQEFLEGGREELEKLIGCTVTEHGEFHYSFQLGNVRVDYWPSSSRWRYKNKAYFGNQRSITGFVERRLKSAKRNNKFPKGTSDKPVA